jgi:putrescine transport system substrate-binding protein
MITLRSLRSPIAGSIALVASLVAGVASAKEVRVYNWSDYIDEEILKDFEKETGIKVVYDVFDSNEVLETKLLAGGSGYDVVVPTGQFLARQIQAGVFQKLDKSKLPNLKYLWPEVSERVAVFDPGNEYAINYMWGTTGLGYNEAKIKELLPDGPVDSFDLLFKPENASKLKGCGIMVLDSPTDVLPVVLQYLGLNPNSKETADLEKAAAVIEAIRPYIQKFHSSEYINALANGDICLAFGWSGDILQAATRAEEAKNGHTIVYSLPKEGTQMWFDMLAIPKDAKNVDEAHAFLDYLMKPEVIAKASNYISYANGNLESQKFIDESILKDTAIYPDAETLKKLFTLLPYDPKTQRIVTRLWTKIVTGQ